MGVLWTNNYWYAILKCASLALPEGKAANAHVTEACTGEPWLSVSSPPKVKGTS